MDNDFDNTYLSKDEIKLLKSMKKNKTIRLSDEQFSKCKIKSMITPITSGQDKYGNFITTGEYKLNQRGENYLEYYKTKVFYRKSDHIRGWITTIISVLGFILSIISLCYSIIVNKI